MKTNWLETYNDIRRSAWNEFWHTSRNWKNVESIQEEVYNHVRATNWEIIREIEYGGRD